MSIHKSLYKASEYDKAKTGRKWPLTTRHDSKPTHIQNLLLKYT